MKREISLGVAIAGIRLMRISQFNLGISTARLSTSEDGCQKLQFKIFKENLVLPAGIIMDRKSVVGRPQQLSTQWLDPMRRNAAHLEVLNLSASLPFPHIWMLSAFTSGCIRGTNPEPGAKSDDHSMLTSQLGPGPRPGHGPRSQWIEYTTKKGERTWMSRDGRVRVGLEDIEYI